MFSCSIHVFWWQQPLGASFTEKPPVQPHCPVLRKAPPARSVWWPEHGGSGQVEITLKDFLERSAGSHTFASTTDSGNDQGWSSQFRTALYALKSQSEDVVLGTTHALSLVYRQGQGIANTLQPILQQICRNKIWQFSLMILFFKKRLRTDIITPVSLQPGPQMPKKGTGV